MSSNRSVSRKATDVADIDAALLSHLAYSLPKQVNDARVAGLKPSEARPVDFGRIGDSVDQRGGVQSQHHTQGQADYLNRNFDLLDVKDFKDGIHAVTVRDKRTGEVTVAFPGTDLSELSDWGRAITIGHNGTMQVTEAAEEYVRSIAEQHGAVHLTGHSAGGTLAMRLTDRLDGKVVARATVFQAPGETRIERIGKGHPRRQKTERVHSTDDPRIVSYQADGDFIGGAWTDPARAEVVDVSEGGAEAGMLEDHSKKNMTNTMINQTVGGLRGLAAEAGISDPTLDAELQRIEGLKFSSSEEQKAGKVKERGPLSCPEQKVARQGTLPQLRAGQAAGEQGQAAPATLPLLKDAVPGQQSRSPGWDMQKMASLARRLEAGQGLSGLAAGPTSGPGAAPKQAVARNLLHRPDGQDHRRTMEIRDLSELDRNAVQLLNSGGSALGSFAELNQRREQARGAAGQRGQGGFGFAGLKNGAATAGGKPAAPGKRVPFDQDAFLNTPLDRLDEAQVRRAMTQPAYYQSWRPFSRDMNDHVTKWFRQAYPG